MCTEYRQQIMNVESGIPAEARQITPVFLGNQPFFEQAKRRLDDRFIGIMMNFDALLGSREVEH